MLEIIDKNQTNKLAIGFNDLKTIHPELLNEWDYDKNDENPSDFTSGSNLPVWWRCERGHSWKARIINRVKGNGCPQCKRELHTSFPEQAILYYLGQICDVESRYLIDGKEADIVIKSKKVAIEYNGYFFHGKAKKATHDEEKEKYFNDKGILLIKVIDTRELIKTYVENNEIHCHMDQKYSALKEVISFICSIIQINCPPINIENDYQLIMKQYFQLAKKGSLAERNPKLAAEWHPTKNGDLKPTDVLPGSNKKAWWLDKEGNEWETKICVRVRYKTGAPQLKGKTITETKLRFRLEKEGSLAKNCPEILKYWDYSKNGELNPNRLFAGSHQKVFLKCPICGYEFSKEIRHEIQKIKTGHPCPNCDKNIKGSKNN